jgi:hypothetical protein
MNADYITERHGGLVSEHARLAGQMTTTTRNPAGPDRLVSKDG